MLSANFIVTKEEIRDWFSPTKYTAISTSHPPNTQYSSTTIAALSYVHTYLVYGDGPGEHERDLHPAGQDPMPERRAQLKEIVKRIDILIYLVPVPYYKQ